MPVARVLLVELCGELRKALPAGRDIDLLSEMLQTRLNLEMAVTDEMIGIARRVRPAACCLVPEKRTEVTTEGGLDAIRLFDPLYPVVQKLGSNGSRVSLFIEPDAAALDAACKLGAPVVEFHTGRFCELEGAERAQELKRINDAAALAARNGIEPHAGHGLTFDNVAPIAAIPQIRELNIGHFLIGEAIFEGLAPVVKRMRELMDAAR